MHQRTVAVVKDARYDLTPEDVVTYCAMRALNRGTGPSLLTKL